MKTVITNATYVRKVSSTRKTLMLTLKRCIMKITKMSVFSHTILYVTNALMRIDTSTKHSNQIIKHLKSGRKNKTKAQGVRYKLTVLHLSRIGVKCLVDNVSLKRSL